MITAEQVREAMRRQGLSQAQVARMSKVSPATVSNWLSGRLEPSDVSKTRIGLALDLIEAGEADDQQIGAAIAPALEDAPEVPALEPPDPADAAPASAPDADHGLMSDEDAAVEEIMDALGMAEPEPPADDANVGEALAGFEPYDLRQRKRREPEPEPASGSRADTAAELLYRLTRVDGVHICEDRDHALSVAIPRGSDLERFACNLDTLDTMLQMDDISAEAHTVAVGSLLASYKRKEEQK
ncbi:MAG: helix-turn-helix transcriptional regulator [Oscillospiraceae bacterium]|nr:helix-turn-helix transcriptional regulator [Oscillospiraceae bacterium]